MKQTRINSKGQTSQLIPVGCTRSPYPKLDALFEQLAHNEHPNVIEMMAAISDLVAFSTEGDTNLGGPPGDRQFMSQKKCRFCD